MPSSLVLAGDGFRTKPTGPTPPNPIATSRSVNLRLSTTTEIQTVQAFPQFREGPLVHTLHSVQDKFAINYGAMSVPGFYWPTGSAWGRCDCTGASSRSFSFPHAIGDPAQIVDLPAASTNLAG